MSDYEEIRQLIAVYCHLFDSHVSREWAQLFTEDGALEINGRRNEGFASLEAFANARSSQITTRHLVTNVVIELNGNLARSRSYLLILRPGASSQAPITGRYEDSLSRVDGRWRFRERRVMFD